MTAPTYGQGFIDLEPTLAQESLARINSQLDRTFKGIRLDIDQGPLNAVKSNLQTVEGLAGDTTVEFGQMARGAGTVDDRIRNLAGHLGLSEAATERMAREMVTAQRNADQLEDSAVKTARALGLSEDEAKKFASAMSQAGESGVAVSRLNTGLSNLRQSFSLMATSAVAFFGVRGLIGFATSARDAFVKLGESANAVNVIFGEGASTIFEFSEGVAQSAGLAKGEFQQMSTVLGAALQNAGFEADVAAEKTVTLTQRAADMASVFNTDVSEALGAIQAALRGESDPIERFGVGLSAARVDAEAAALGFKKVAGEFDSTAKTAARLSLIMAQTDAVAGDFVNTSDSLANAWRINEAEMENVRAELGEGMLPIFEALTDAAPVLVEGLRDMVPNVVSLTQSLAQMSKSTPGVLDLVDALGVLTSLPRGLGQLFDLGPISTLIGIMQGDPLRAWNNTLKRMNTEGLIEDLRGGADAATTLANRLADVGRRGKIDKQFIRDLKDIAGTDLRESAAALQAVIEASEQLGLETPEVADLRDVYIELVAEMDAATRASEGARFGGQAAEEAIPSFVRLEDRIAGTGLKLEELAFSAEPAAQAFREGLSAYEETALRLDAIASSSEVAAGILDTQLRRSIVDVGGALTDLNEDGKTTTSEFIRNLAEMTAATLAFRADIASIAVISPEAARALQALPEEAREEILKGLRDDPESILQVEEALLGSPEQLAGQVRSVVGSAMDLLATNPDQATVDAFAAIVLPDLPPGHEQAVTDILQGVLDVSFADLESPDSQQLILDSIDGWSSVEIAAAVNDALTAGLRTVDLSDAGDDARATFYNALSTPTGEELSSLRNSITKTLDAAIQRKSPPKLFSDAGEDARDAFWAPFKTMPLDFPTVDFRRHIGAFNVIEPDEGTGSGGGPLIENVNFYDAREKPAEESLQEAALAVELSGFLHRR